MSETRVVVFENGVVTNTIIADPATYKDPSGGSVVANATAETGWTTNDGGQTFVAPAPPAPTVADLIAYASTKQNNLLAGTVWSFNVGTQSAPIVVTTKLDSGGQAAMLQLLAWSQYAQSTDTEAYSNVDFSTATLTPAQARGLALEAGAVKSQTMLVLNQLVAGITASPPTITADAQIDAAAWPTSPAAAPASSSTSSAAPASSASAAS